MTCANTLPPDPIRDAGFPAVEQLRRGVVLNCIAHSFWLTAHQPVFQMSWEDDTFFEDNIQGEHWAVAFAPDGAVAVFYSSESDRNPYPDGSPPYDQSPYFKGMPRRLESVRTHALSQMHDLNFACGNPSGAVVTAAMWADGARFTATEPWEGVYDHSLWVLREYLRPSEEALREWWNGMAFPDSLRWGAWSLFERRLAASVPVIPVEPREWEVFVQVAGGDPDKAALAGELLAGVGITVEPLADAPATDPGTSKNSEFPS